MNEDYGAFTYDSVTVGDSALFPVSITKELVDNFAEFSGDKNPLHIEEAYAQTTPFQGRIAHGMIVGALFSRLVGMHLPGKYALYLSQTLQFREPMRIGEEMVIHGEVVHKSDSAKTITIKTVAKNRTGEKIFVQGEALVKLLR